MLVASLRDAIRSQSLEIENLKKQLREKEKTTDGNDDVCLIVTISCLLPKTMFYSELRYKIRSHHYPLSCIVLRKSGKKSRRSRRIC
jgi:hypothetical protein